MGAKAYGSITIVDITDLGTLSVYPESNQPQSVIFDPNQNNKYVPDWSTNNLVLSPVCYYGNVQVNPNVTWKRKVGSADAVAVSSSNGESVSAGKLTVNKNVLTEQNPIITYICTATYVEPQSQATLVAEGRITFSLISQPTTIKSCSLTGESVFLYKSDGTLVGTGSITLNANVQNASISKWQYKNASGSWVTISGQTGSSFTVKATDTTYFVNDLATIKVVTNVSGVEDIVTITKIRDGAAGKDTLNATLSNENQMLPCNSSGTVTSYADAFTTITVYNGNEDVTSASSISVEPSSGVTGDWDSVNTTTYKVTGLSGDTGNVLFTITYNGKTITQMFSVVKVKAGVNGTSPTIYSLDVSSLVVNKNTSNVFTPSAITLKGYSQTGSGAKSAYSGRFKIYIDGSTTANYTSGSNESSKAYDVPSSATKSIKVELYASGGTSTLLDSQTIVVTSDGAKGAQGDTGAAGSDSYNFILGNYSDVIPCTTGRTVSSARTIEIPFSAYKGITRLACTAKLGTLPSGVTSSISSATTSADGKITLTFASGANLGGTTAAYDSGNISITLTADSKTSLKTYSWAKNVQASSGANAVLLQIYTPTGNTFNNANDSATLELKTQLTDGSTTVTSGITYQWYKFNGTGYGAISSATSSSLSVSNADVDSYCSFKCIATYKSKTYEAYCSVYDKSDPLQPEVFSTLGDKITNSVGVGCVYVKCFRNGEEIDPLQNLTVSKTTPSSPKTGDYWAFIDESNKIVVLKKYSGSAWTNMTASNYTKKFTVTWMLKNANGQTLADYKGSSDVASGRFLYVSGDILDKKVIFDFMVEN